ncbi:ankyrin repeat-containing domain protein [Rhodocollybia butyracea]|uniref:Ankyrin repeat-containing domain protein n=1 Tax=Rhodocollybia butyracea TaxID=206335 RepID=A0A9P5TY05_9AGAR|nr:ankyrin repeat-containing domain protein [Rhodocollybia butyracea]
MPKGESMGMHSRQLQAVDIRILCASSGAQADVNAQGGEYGNALQAAISQGDKDIVQLLLEHKADVNAQGGTSSGHKADVNAQGGYYGNALEAAISQGDIDVVQLLLEHKADLLLEHKADVNAQGGVWECTPGSLPVGDIDIVQLLLEHKADVNAQGGAYGNALQVACRWRDIDIVQLLLEHKADLLLEHKADVNAQGGEYGNALQAACRGETLILSSFFWSTKQICKCQGEGMECTRAAISQGHKDIVQLLLEHKADVNAQGGEYGMHSSFCEGTGYCPLLLEHKADVNAKGRVWECTPASSGAQADVNAQGGKYGNALQAAISQGHKDIVQLLLEHKADVNAQGGYYGNALQAAISEETRRLFTFFWSTKQM